MGSSWMRNNWRPTLMFVMSAILANTYIVHPYISLFFSHPISVEFPPRLWDLMAISVGGYVAGRTGEKIVTAMKAGKEGSNG